MLLGPFSFQIWTVCRTIPPFAKGERQGIFPRWYRKKVAELIAAEIALMVTLSLAVTLGFAATTRQ